MGKKADVVQVAGPGAPEGSSPIRSKKATKFGASGVEGSTKRNRSKAKSPGKVKAASDVPQHTSGQERLTLSCSNIVSAKLRGRPKLIIFNVQSTLLDSSLLASKNPNS